jgi:mannobiose 2-epimerase
MSTSSLPQPNSHQTGRPPWAAPISAQPPGAASSPALPLATWRRQIETELTGNILPFWIEHTVDVGHGGFVGALTNDLEIHNEAPRSSVICARILWTYAAAFRRFRRPTYLKMAARAYSYLTEVFWDDQHQGVYWQVNAEGHPINLRKHSYAQAFAIYGLAEYYLATGDEQSLARARQLFALFERHAHDPVHGGYIEGCGEAWDALADMRLSDKEPDCRKSMNTLLHILEAYTNLLRVADEPLLRTRLGELIDIFLDKVMTPAAPPALPATPPASQTPVTPAAISAPSLAGPANLARFHLFFDDAWQPLPDHVSYGHDIEGSWLLVEAAKALGDPSRMARTEAAAISLAAAVLQNGLAPDGSVVYARHRDGSVDATKHWWAQAECVVGFINAWQICHSEPYYAAAQTLWHVIETQFVDRTNGEWYKVLDPQGRPLATQYKVGPWECPYHHARMCLELLTRFGA